ncbi:LuxR C-terminal-related transcriptional regulator [Pseudonocardia hispaniensis]|uniref:LuxR C-terminal-related transcriptional regulator n=1 Tax=Pseudonocardia hispaniensis TaxID=904933 RepID=A0ABW1J2B1_9PSEU
MATATNHSGRLTAHRGMRNGRTGPAVAAGPGTADVKFTVPVVTHVVPRTRLHTVLTACLGDPCTLIAAPAGWGKTVLVSSWLADGGAGRAAVWITLSSADDDVRAFWSTVATALAPVVGERTASEIRHAATDTDVDDVPRQLAAALAERGTPVVLVLDNLHELTSPAVHESLLRLVRRPPPELRFVATTRRDPPWPVHRLRLEGVLTEIRAAELAFRADEAAALFAQLGVELDEAYLGRVIERTEGWVAGLRLAALELRDAVDPAPFVDAFSGNDHAVAAYLLSEVLDRLTPELLEFLVTVSILDLVSADLADALTGRQTGAATLTELAASNLFVQAIGPAGRWYRLHRLIADVLRARITDRRTLRDLHRRAAEWHRRHSMPLDALRHALRGGLWSLAADLAGINVVALLIRGSARDVEVLLSGVPRDTLLRHPELAAALAGARILQGSSVEVGELTAAARAGQAGLPARRGTRLRVILDLIEMGIARTRGDLAAVAAAARRVPDDPRVLAGLGLAAWDVVPLIVLGNAGTAELWTGDMIEAEKHLRAALDTSHSGGLLRPHLNAAAQLALLHCEHGDLTLAEAEANALAECAAEAGWSVSAQAVGAYLALARVSLDRAEPAEADRWLARVVEVEAVAPEPHVQLAAAALMALRRADAGDVEGALAGLRAASGRTDTTPVLADRLRQVEADLVRRTGDFRRAGELLSGLRGPVTPEIAHARGRLYLAAGDVEAAEHAVSPSAPTSVRHQVNGGVLRALIAAARDDAMALSWLEDALLAAAPFGIRRPFLVESAELRALLTDRIEAGTAATAFAVDLLRRMSGRGPHPPAPAKPIEPLTEREQVVLRYMASTLTNAEIAAELYLSVNTVKSHQRMVYRKLGADGRRDAVRRARELRLL